LFRHLYGIIHLDAKVPHYTLRFGMTQQQLNCPQILCPPVNQCRFGSANRMRAKRVIVFSRAAERDI
jgi:hypothetical protein